MSGHVLYTVRPGYMDHGPTGTTHGSGYDYDVHVPVVFYGAGIKKGESVKPVTITQIAPTVCELLRINRPNGCSADPIADIFR
jgi:phosphopentomutase